MSVARLAGHGRRASRGSGNLTPLVSAAVSAVEELVVRGVGHDKPGVVAEMSKMIADHHGSIQDSRMTRKGGDLAVMMKVSAQTQDMAGIMEGLKSFKGMTITAAPTTTTATAQQLQLEPLFRASFKVVANNEPTVVGRVMDMLLSQGCHIETLRTYTRIAPFGGAEVLEVEGQVVSLLPVDISEVREAATQLDLDTGIHVDLEEMPAAPTAATATTEVQDVPLAMVLSMISGGPSL